MKAFEYYIDGEHAGDNFEMFLEDFEFAGEGYKCVGIRTENLTYIATMRRLDGSTFQHQFYPELVYNPEEDDTWK